MRALVRIGPTACALAALLALGACRGKGGPGGDDADEVSAELPAMSPGTIQAIGPHVYTSTLETSRSDAGDGEPANDRLELVYQDIDHYRMSRWSDGVLDLEEYRDDDLFVFRKARGGFRWGQAVAGSSYLLDTIHPCERTLGNFSSELWIEEIDTRPEDPEGFRRFTLRLRPEAADDPDREQRALAAGHSSLPLTLSGEVVTDEFGNRREAQIDGTFRDRRQGVFEEMVTAVTYFESRVGAPDGVGLQPPVAATPMILERKAERARVDTPKSAPIP